MRNDTGHQLQKFDTNLITNSKMVDKTAAVQGHACISNVYVSLKCDSILHFVVFQLLCWAFLLSVFRMKYRLFFIKLFLLGVMLIIQLFTLCGCSKILKWFNTKFIHVISGIENCLELICCSCVVQFSVTVTITQLVLYDCFLHNLNGKSIKM